MAHFAQSIKVNLTGTLGQGEVFATGFYCITSDPPADQAAFQAMVNAYATAAAGAIAALRPFLSSDGSYDLVKAYYYNGAGNSPAIYIAQASVNLAGSGGASTPLQNAIVASLSTINPTRSGKGRMYFPCTGAATTLHQLTAAQISSVAAGAKGILAACKPAFGASAFPIVNAQVLGAPQAVLGVRVDSKVDTQRRRSGKETVLFQTSLAYP